MMNKASDNSLAVNKATLEPWQTKTLLFGGLVGAGVGLLSAFLLIKNSEQSGAKPELSFREGFQIAVLAFGVIRSVSKLWEE